MLCMFIQIHPRCIFHIFIYIYIHIYIYIYHYWVCLYIEIHARIKYVCMYNIYIYYIYYGVHTTCYSINLQYFGVHTTNGKTKGNKISSKKVCNSFTVPGKDNQCHIHEFGIFAWRWTPCDLLPQISLWQRASTIKHWGRLDTLNNGLLKQNPLPQVYGEDPQSASISIN